MSRQKLGSMAYQVTHFEWDKRKHGKRGKGDISPQCARQYTMHTIKFAEWCREQYCVKAISDCREYIQAYSDWLTASGKSESTAHTYLAAVCRFFGVSLASIKKRSRICAHNKRSRNVKAPDAGGRMTREASPRLYDFAAKVGIRRAEYARLRGEDFKTDETGYPCVYVAKGKGGKRQMQRILPEDVAFVRSYFDGSERYIFTKDEMKNKIDLHALRGEQARYAYEYYLDRIKNEGRDKLISEIKARWDAYCDKPWNKNIVCEKVYYLRGANKELAIKQGLPVTYDRLALLAVSVFHLSHWRLDVTVSNYMLAVGYPVS